MQISQVKLQIHSSKVGFLKGVWQGFWKQKKNYFFIVGDRRQNFVIYHLLDIQNVQATDMRYNKDKTRIRIQIVRQYVATHSLLWSQPSTALRVALADLKRLKKVKQVQAQGLWFTRIFIVLLEQVAVANVATTFVGAERTKSSVHLGLESFTTLLRKLSLRVTHALQVQTLRSWAPGDNLVKARTDLFFALWSYFRCTDKD